MAMMVMHLQNMQQGTKMYQPAEWESKLMALQY